MDYEGWICRGPMERGAYMLPVAAGCSYNRCRFCMLFKHIAYRELPIEQIEQELLRIKALGAKPTRVFLGDGNAFCMDTARLIEILTMARRHFPGIECFNMDATVTGISKKSDAELSALHELGVNRLYLGIESGLDDVLAFMQKDHTVSQAYTQIDRLHAHGLSYGAHIMTGIAGQGRGIENAEATAEFLSRTKPEAIINFSMFVHRSAPLYSSIESGAFTPADELENLKEERRLLEFIQTDGVDYDGFHDCIEFRVRGRIPADREKMLAKLDSAILIQQTKPAVIAWAR